jgi:hypothetical protein
MLDMFILASTSLSLHPTISASINDMRAVVMSNVYGITPNHLLQQMYGTQVLDEDIDLELSDEELELIAKKPPVCYSSANTACTKGSDVFVGNQQIIDFGDINNKGLLKPEKHDDLINYIRQRFGNIPVSNPQIYARIAEHIRATAPIQTKRQRGGIKIALTGPYAGVECYNDTPCQF